MAKKTEIREISLVEDKGTFEVLFKRLYGEDPDYDFDSLSALRSLLSNEKARLLHTIRTKNPNSIYKLAGILKRDFASVLKDVKLLERFGFLSLVAEKTGKRERLKPIISTDRIRLDIKI